MLCLLWVLLSCGVLCLASPVPPTAGTGCVPSSLIQETREDVQTLKSKGNSTISPLSNTMEEGGDITTILEGFIEALKSNNETSKETRLVAHKLQKIQDAGKSCLGWMDLGPEGKDFFSDLDYLLRYLNHNATSKERA